MALMDDKKKPGLSNPIAKAQGYPTSGLMQANQGKLPSQLQQSPYQHQATGGITGQAVQGSQFKTQPVAMSGGVAQYIAIPGSGASYAAPQQGGPWGVKTGALGGGQSQDGLGRPPKADDPTLDGLGTPPQATAADATPKWTPLQDIEKMRHQFDRGSEFDVQARRAMLEQQANLARAGAVQSAFAGRGSGVAGVEREYADLRALGDYEGQRAQMQAQAEQQAYNNQMAYAQMVNQTKVQLAQIAKEMGLTFDDQAFNQMGAEIVAQTGQTPSESQMLALLKQHGGTPSKVSLDTKIAQIRAGVASWSMDAEAQYTKVFLSLTAQEVRDLWAKDPQLVRDMLADTWGSENSQITVKLIDSGVVVD